MTEAQVLEVLAACAAQGLPVWVDGGWAVDAVLGRQTRPHEDLDLATRVEDGPALEALLAGLGLIRQAGGPAWNPVYSDGGGLRVDLHLFRLDAAGRGVMDPDDPAVAYPAGSFDGRGAIAGRAVDCLPADILWRLKTGYPPRDRDLLDLAAPWRRRQLDRPLQHGEDGVPGLRDGVRREGAGQAEEPPVAEGGDAGVRDHAAPTR